MVFAAAQTTHLFEHANSMALQHDAYVAVQNEGVVAVADLQEFDAESSKMVAESLRNPGGRIPNPDPQAAAGSAIQMPPCAFRAKSRLRLTAASEILRHCVTVGILHQVT